MKKKAKKVDHLLCECPFCGTLCDYHTDLTWCSGCYTEYKINKSGNVWFDTSLHTERFAWAKAITKMGGMSMGQTTK